MRSVVITAICFVTMCDAFRSFQSAIPNGDAVPNPCTPDVDTWRGVGHIAERGGGTRNPFGVQLALASNTWTTELCNSDSDSDGISNGAELGDPNCAWTTGATPETAALSHPAICEPVTSSSCKEINTWVELCPEADVITTIPITDSLTTTPQTTPTTPQTTVLLTTTTPLTIPTTPITVPTTPTQTPTTPAPTIQASTTQSTTMPQTTTIPEPMTQTTTVPAPTMQTTIVPAPTMTTAPGPNIPRPTVTTNSTHSPVTARTEVPTVPTTLARTTGAPSTLQTPVTTASTTVTTPSSNRSRTSSSSGIGSNPSTTQKQNDEVSASTKPASPQKESDSDSALKSHGGRDFLSFNLLILFGAILTMCYF